MTSKLERVLNKVRESGDTGRPKVTIGMWVTPEAKKGLQELAESCGFMNGLVPNLTGFLQALGEATYEINSTENEAADNIELEEDPPIRGPRVPVKFI